MAERPTGSLPEVIAQDIEKQIVSGKLRPGDFVGNKTDLAARYKVAPNTLNEALRALRARSIVRAQRGPGGGIFVAEAPPMMRFGNMLMKLQGTTHFADGALTVKDALDPQIAIDAALHRKPSDIKELRAILHEMAVGSAPTATAAVQLHWSLHRRIGEITPNAVLRSLYLGLMDVLREELVEIVAKRPKIDHRMEVHIRLVDAIAGGDPDAARYWGGEQHQFAFGTRRDAPGMPHSDARPTREQLAAGLPKPRAAKRARG
jgi:DNA-binding FadR family transcriptional regulator